MFHRKQKKFTGLLRALLCVMAVLLTSTSAQTAEEKQLVINRATRSSPRGLTNSEGVSSDGATSYFSFNGFNGLKLPISMPRQPEFDYTIKFWFRSHLDPDGLLHSTHQRQYLFDLPECCSCYIEGGRALKCSVYKLADDESEEAKVTTFELPDVSALPDIQSWIHLTYSAEWANEALGGGQSYLRLDFPTEHLTFRGDYSSIKSPEVYVGIGSDLKRGFDGDIQEVWISLGYIDDKEVTKIMNSEMVFDVSTMGYYKFQSAFGRLDDAMRDQQAELIMSTLQDRANPIQPAHMEEIGTYPYCDTLPSTFEHIPMFEGAGLNPYEIPVKNYTEAQRDFGYTASFWVKNIGGQTFSRSPGIGRNKHHLIHLQEAFAIWFDSKTSFRVYVFAKDNEFETWTDSVFLPLNQWTNIQLTLNSTVGITVMTFNSNGERQQIMHKPIFLAEQKPSPKLLLFQNFIGYGYRVEIWEKFFQTPIQPEEIGEDRKIIDYALTKTNYGTEGGIQGFKSLLSEGQTMAAKEGRGFNFVAAKLPTAANFTEPSSLGQIHANGTLWDGVACPNAAQNQAYFNKKGSSVTLNRVIEPTDSYTVEFWFRFPEDVSLSGAQDMTYLFTMSEGSEETEAMSIYIEANKLKCAPFGAKGNGAGAVLTYSGVNVFSSKKWQHVSCSYQQGKYIIGQYVSIDLATTRDARNDLKPLTFSRSIAWSDQRILNYIQKVKWTVTLGNNWDSSLTQDAYFKDLRVWSSVRSPTDLYTYRVKQVPFSADLQVNLKLMDGSPVVVNYATTPDRNQLERATANYVKFVPADGGCLVCAADMYFDADGKGCTPFPYTSNVPIIYRVVNSVQHGHQMILQRDFGHSIMALPGEYQPQLNSLWTIDNEQAFGLYLEGRQDLGMLSFDAIYMGDGNSYKFQALLTDARTHEFYQATQQQVLPRKCSLVIDKRTEKSVNTMEKVLATDTAADLCFEFKVDRVDGCDDEYDSTLQSTVGIEAHPPVDPALINNVRRSFNSADQQFNLCFQGADIAAGALPMDIPVNFIFTVFWKPNGQTREDKGTSYMNIVYTVNYQTAIKANLTASKEEFDVDDTAVFNAGQSAFRVSESRAGIMFKWKCPEPFTAYCDGWQGSPVLEIPPSTFRNLGGKMLHDYVFTVQTWSIESGNAPADMFESSVIVQWKILQAPVFALTIMGEDQRMYVTRPSEIQIPMVNYRNTYEFLEFDWELTPAGSFNASRISMSSDRSAFLFEPGALKFGVKYTLNVTITNSENTEDGTASKAVTFETEAAPAAGTIRVSPASGVMFQDDFTVSLSGFASQNGPLTYALYGITSLDNQDDVIRLSAGDKPLTGGGVTETVKLPYLVGLKAVVTDNAGEVVSASANVTVSSSGSEIGWLGVAEDIERTQSESPQQKWQYYAFVANSANRDATNGETTGQDARDTNNFIAQEAIIDVQTISATQTDQQTLDMIRGITETLLRIAQGSFNSAYVIQSTADALEYVQTREKAMEKLLEDETYVQTFLNALGTMMDFSARRAEALVLIELTPTFAEEIASQLQLRNLQDEQAPESSAETGESETDEADGELTALRKLMKKFIVIKNKYLDMLCDTMTGFNLQHKVTSPLLELIVTKVKTGDKSYANIHFVNSFDGTTSVIPTKELIRQSLDFNQDAASICVQQSFMKVDPVSGYMFDSQFPAHEVFSQTDSIDDMGQRLLSQQGFGFLNTNEFELHFGYAFPEGDFFRNQTICMSFDGNQESFIDERWQKERCQTKYNVVEEDMSQSTIICQCSELKNHYIGLITDRSRELEVIVEFRYKFHQILLWVVIPFLLLGCCCPLCAWQLDTYSLMHIEDDDYDVGDHLVEELHKTRYKRYKYKQQIYYNLQQIEEFQNLKNFRAGSWSAIWLYLRHLHPILHVATIFDIGFKRLFRLSLITAQLSLITLLCWAAYSKRLEEMSMEWGYGDFRRVRDHKVLYVSLILSILTIPVPNFMVSCFRTKMYAYKVDQRGTSYRERAKQVRDKWESDQMDPDYDVGEGNEQDTEDGEGYRVALIDEYMQLKIIFITSMYIFWACVGALSVAYTVMSAQEAGNNMWRQIFAMTEADARDFVYTWYCAIFLWGYGVLNGLYAYVTSLLAPGQAKYEYELEAQKQDLDSCCGWGRCSLTQCFCISRESVEIGLDVFAVIHIVQQMERRGISKGKDTKFKEESEAESDQQPHAVEMQDRRAYNTGASHVGKPAMAQLGIQDKPSEESEGEISNRHGGFESAVNKRVNKPQQSDIEDPSIPRPNIRHEESDREEVKSPREMKKEKKEKKEKKHKKDKKDKKHKKDKKEKKDKKKHKHDEDV